MNIVRTPNLDTFKETMHTNAQNNLESDDLTITAFYLGLALNKVKEGKVSGSFSKIGSLDAEMMFKFIKAANADGFEIRKIKDGIFNKYQIKVAA